MFRSITRVLGSVAVLCFAGNVVDKIPTSAPSWQELAVLAALLFAGWLLVAGVSDMTLSIVTACRRSADASDPDGPIRPIAVMRRPGDPVVDCSLETTARHEAAHAVAVLVLGHELIEVSSAPNHQTSASGYVRWVHPEEPSVDQVTVALIGNLAQHKPHDHRVGGLGDDLQSALRASLVAAMASGENPSQVLDRGMERARHILADHTTEIDTLAAALSAEPTKLAGEKVLELLDLGLEHASGQTSHETPRRD